MTTMKSSKSHSHKKGQGKWWMYSKKNTKTKAKVVLSTNDKANLDDTSNTKPNSSKEQSIGPMLLIHKKKNKRKRKSKNKTSGTPDAVVKSGERLQEKSGKKNKEKAAKESEPNTQVHEVVNKKTTDIDQNQSELINKTGTTTSKELKSSSMTKISKRKRRKLKILKRREKEKGASKDSMGVIQRSKKSEVAKRTKESHPGSVKAELGDNTERELSVQNEMDRGHSVGGLDPSEGHISLGDGPDGALRKRKRKRAKQKQHQQEQEENDVKKRKVDKETLDSGMSSGAETPNLPSNPQDVAANWKVLISKLNKSAPTKYKSKLKKNLEKDEGSKKEVEIWFDDVDAALVEAEKMSSQDGLAEESADASGVKSNQITKCVGMDCEMVGTGHQGKESILARVSMVNEYGQCIYDKFVKPREKVTDYRTEFSGVRPSNLYRAEEFLTVQKEVADILKDKVLVGHALKNDMKVLFLGHPRRLIRDTASYPPFRELMKTKRPALRKLAKSVLGVTIQEGEHSSVVDARTAMRLYTLHRAAWEKRVKLKGKVPKKESPC